MDTDALLGSTASEFTLFSAAHPGLRHEIVDAHAHD